MTDPEIRQAIDACRPGSEDLSLPEMAPLADAIQQDKEVQRIYDRAQRYDAAVGRAFREAPVPAGLLERLLRAAAAADEPISEQGQEGAEPTVSTADQAARGVDRGRRRRSRPWGLVAAAAAVVAASVLVVFLVNGGAPEPVANVSLQRDVTAWAGQVVRRGWSDDLASPLLRTRPLDDAIAANPRRWCQVETRYDDQTLVYDLAGSDADFALVFCLRSPARDSVLPPMPPHKPYPPTGGVRLGVWRRGDLVYVLAVKGDEKRYRQFLDSSIMFGLLPLDSPWPS
jgi:hypothetical protein